jgi:hypothetical protein
LCHSAPEAIIAESHSRSEVCTMAHICRIWCFSTANLRVEVNAYDEEDPDFSFDESGEVARKVASGEFTCFRTEVTVYDRDGRELGSAHLGNSIYEDPKDFRDHVGLAILSRKDGRNYGSYFLDKVREACAEARKVLLDLRSIPVRGAEASGPGARP